MPPPDPIELAAFLVEAKRRTYAAQGDEATVPPALSGSRQLEHRAGPFLYRDVYFGGAYFVGQETVYHRGRPVWSMSYAGGVLSPVTSPDEIAATYAFLRAALLRVEPDRPFRGPRSYRDGAYAYRDRSRGSFERFRGSETISRAGETVYQLT